MDIMVLTIFGVLKNSLEVLYEVDAFDEPVETADSYDFSTLLNTLPHYLIKQKFSDSIKWCSEMSDHKYICCNNGRSLA